MMEKPVDHMKRAKLRRLAFLNWTKPFEDFEILRGMNDLVYLLDPDNAEVLQNLSLGKSISHLSYDQYWSLQDFDDELSLNYNWDLANLWADACGKVERRAFFQSRSDKLLARVTLPQLRFWLEEHYPWKVRTKAERSEDLKNLMTSLKENPRRLIRGRQ
jgi:hypothetical protein